MDIKEKIEKIMEKEQMNSAQFAAAIGIQGSTLSHILNGRNNPSLDVLTKILKYFQTISSDWLLMDLGSMYRTEKQPQMPSLFENIDETTSKSSSLDQNYTPKSNVPSATIQQNNPLITENPIQLTPEPLQNYKAIIESPSKSVRKIIVYYTDNTFQEFETK
ncbi:MAG: helix-turn-helix transcriptional regulator [Paludibacter sp.]